MPNTILHKRGTTVPTPSVLQTGEIAINTTNGFAYTKTDAGSVVQIGQSPDLSGYAPLASPAFSGVPTAPTPLASDNSTTIATTAYVTNAIASSTTSPSTQKVTKTVRNATGSIVPKRSVVYINGANGTHPTISLAQANAESTSYRTFGITESDIAINGDGVVVIIGEVLNVDTGSFADGDQLYLSPTVAGGITNVKPSAPNHMVYVGVVTRANNNNGKIEVNIANGYELQELHNVSITTPANGDFLGYDAGLWKNRTSAQMGIPTAATSTEARFQTESNKFLTPNTAHWMMMNPNIIQIQRAGFTVTNTGTITSTAGGWISSYTQTGTAGACSSRWRTFGASQIDQTNSMTEKQNPQSYFNFSNPSWCSGRSLLNGITESVFSWGFYHGKAENDGVGVLTRRGYGWRATGGAGTRYLSLEVHNGTTLTSVTSTYALTAGIAFDWDLISNGSGTVTLYVNGNQVATSSDGPTGTVNVTPVVWQEEVATSAASVGAFNGMVHSRGKFIAFDPS